MSDKPQPQQSSQGWAPKEPEPGPQAAPGGPGSDDTPGDPGGTDAPGKPGKPGKKPRRKRTGWGRLIPTWRMVLGTFLGAILLVIGLFALGYYLVKIPPANAAATKQSNVYLYADGSQLARDGEVNRENVALAEISKDAQHAALAAEDRDFYTESAVDPKAMIRAGWNTATGKGKQSGSTITQQYVKNYYLGQEQTATRKVKEFFISIKLDRQKSKDDILEGYLNTSYYGRNAYGIQAAAQAYYGVDAKNLTVGQGAYLAALLNAPSEYDVVAHPENKSAAVARWNYVLDGMVKKNWLTQADRTKVTFPQPKQEVVAAAMSGQRGYLVQAVKDYLVSNKIIDEDTLTTGGYRITTTLQKSRQNAFVKAVDDQVMSNLDKKNRKVDRYVRAAWASPSTRPPARSSRCTAASTTPSSTSTTRRAVTTKSARPSSRSSSPRPCRTARRRRTAARSPRTRSTTAPTSAPCRAGAAARTRPRTRTTARTGPSRYAPPPTSR